MEYFKCSAWFGIMRPKGDKRTFLLQKDKAEAGRWYIYNSIKNVSH